MIKLLESLEEQEQFKSLVSYCFNLDQEESNKIFPLREEDYALGCFQGKDLLAGFVSHSFESVHFSRRIKSAGIGFVASFPQYRNGGLIRELMIHELKKEYRDGKCLSTLYPFSFRFYQRFGYGSLGPAAAYTIKPEEIRLTTPPKGELVKVEGEDEGQFRKDMREVYNHWVQGYDFGIIRHQQMEKPNLLEELKREGRHCFLYYDSRGSCRGMIQFKLKQIRPFEIHLQIRRIAWWDAEAFQALMYLLWVHRGQCSQIEWTTAASVPLALISSTGRVACRHVHEWMGRAVRIAELLAMKVQSTPVKGRIVFSLRDEIIPENTGTYTVEETGVEKSEYRDENTIPLEVFSALLFGGYSLAQARLAGFVSGQPSPPLERFFSRNPNIFLSEPF